MKVDEGNIFQMMRLILPEHREMMKDFEANRHVVAHSKSFEACDEELCRQIDEAVRTKRRVTIQLRHRDTNEEQRGVLVIKRGQLYVACPSGRELVDVKNIMSLCEEDTVTREGDGLHFGDDFALW